MRKKVLIVYKSKTGFTKKYAEMIKTEVECAIADYKNVTSKVMSEYQVIVFGSRAHAGRIDGYQKAKKMFQASGAEHFLLFVTGAAPNDQEQVIEEFWKQNLSKTEWKNIPHFYMQAGLCYEKMSFGDKLMMKGAASMLKKKKEKNAYEQEFERAIAGSYDISSREYIEPLVSCLKDMLE